MKKVWLRHDLNEKKELNLVSYGKQPKKKLKQQRVRVTTGKSKT